jgi:hypothetical protein
MLKRKYTSFSDHMQPEVSMNTVTFHEVPPGVPPDLAAQLPEIIHIVIDGDVRRLPQQGSEFFETQCLALFSCLLNLGPLGFLLGELTITIGSGDARVEGTVTVAQGCLAEARRTVDQVDRIAHGISAWHISSLTIHVTPGVMTVKV